MDARIDPVAFALQKDSEFFELFNYYMIKLYHSGVLEYLRTKWFDDRKPQACSCKTEEVILASSLEILYCFYIGKLCVGLGPWI